MSPDNPVAAAERLLSSSITEQIFPAASVEVGSSTEVLWRAAFGRLTFEPDSAAAEPDTIFDLASLTKPLATTSVALDLTDEGCWTLDDRVAAHAPEWAGLDRMHVSIVDLLEHASGLSARLLGMPPPDRREFEHEICTIPLEYAPRSRSIYSDLGFILLGFCAEHVSGTTLEALTRAVLDRLTPLPAAPDTWIGTHVAKELKARTAPTIPLADDRRRRMLAGEVHDNYADILGGFAGHSGLFGTAGGVGMLARVWLRAARGVAGTPSPLTPALASIALRRSTVAGSSRALGWDTMLPTSSCGGRLSSAAFGHVGFTGTSLWIDPHRDRYFVLLTNRACRGGSSDQMQKVRRAFHDTLADF